MWLCDCAQPRFMSKKEREELALVRREEAAGQQRQRLDEMRRMREQAVVGLGL